MNHILFPITWQCNLSCAFCCSKRRGPVNINESLLSVYEKKGQVPWVYITGGEPFLLGQKLFDTCDTLRSNGFKVGVTTNGTFFNPEIAKHVDRLGISLDGCKEYHDTYRGAGVFDKALMLLKAVVNQRLCETVVMSVDFKINSDALKKLEPIIEKIEPTYWQVQSQI